MHMRAGQNPDANDSGLGLGGDKADAVFAWDERSGASYLAEKRAALDGVGKDRAIDRGICGLEPKNEEGGDCQHKGACG